MKRPAACQGIVWSTGIHFIQPERLKSAWRRVHHQPLSSSDRQATNTFAPQIS